MRLRIRSVQLIFLVAHLVAVELSQAQIVELPTRNTPRPATTNGVPHVQIGVETFAELRNALLQRVSNIPDVEIRNSIISLPGAKGLWLKDELSLAHPEVIVGGREFAHVHPDGSLHASLHPDMARAAVKTGWAIPHPWSNQRPGWEGFVMVYSPQSAEDLEVVYQLVLQSYQFVTGRDLN